ncbi:putative spermidine/putrescine transport system ATP-binding protein [Microbacterium azadirachtae]|nr:putative spermidine/putrescine transport system ATP-binding protein [Microbacterium azadirachtae]SEF66581.1 putative spermidine/putrescine transport system ATP-binding protein [Microbacterium azadirachtae]SEF67352.1 putative spermidine/putrescine transport system ATP-binding protein [Microbacterium azadirachtae]
MPARSPLDTGSAVAMESVTKSYGSTTVLHNLNLALAPGELVCLLGPSGCGKTTALRCIAGLEEVSGGRVLIGSRDVTDLPVNKRDIGMVFQQYTLFPHLTVAKNVEFGLAMRKVARAERATRIAEMLEIVGLDHLASRFPHELSGGQQQRVALARALVTKPRALLLDEPLSALDAKVRVKLREQIRIIQTELGITTVFVTHDQEEALAISDRVAVMEAGRIAQLGTPEQLYRQPVSAFVADFVGLSNRIEGLYSGRQVRIPGASLPVITVPAAISDGTPVTAFVRPENVRLEAVADDVARDGIRGRVASSGFLGAVRRTIVHYADSTIASQHDGDSEYAPGDEVIIRFREEPVTIAADAPMAAGSGIVRAVPADV